MTDDLKRDFAEALEQQAATREVLRLISSSPTAVLPVFDMIVQRAVRLCDGLFSTAFQFDGELIHLVAQHNFSPAALEFFRRVYPTHPQRGASLVAWAILERKMIHIADCQNDTTVPEALRQFARDAGFQSAVAAPMLREGKTIGAIAVSRAEPKPFSVAQINLLQTFADQAVIAVENARLFEEVVQRSRALEIANQHKSQFVANMSHELRTPLAAMLGYSELIQEGFYGPPPQKSIEALGRIRANGKHLLGLINTVLDIAKIESGQFSLNLGEYALESVIETVRAATESLAQNKKLALITDVGIRLPTGFGDEQRLTQVLLNLVGNALKFTDVGEVRVSATVANNSFAISVADTGPGIPTAEQIRIFEQFHQVDSSNTRAKGGTGLGLAIAKQIVEMHGGRIWVDSALGHGSTFHLQLPVRAQIVKAAA
jgi:signal transduction histidine kinase